MSVRYKILFVTEILHDYYASGVSKDFSIVPTEATAEIMKGQGMLYKMLGNKLYVLVKVNDDDTPMIDIDPNKQLAFYMQIENPHFINITNLDNNFSNSNRYYFTNLHQTEVGASLYLNNKVPLYNVANDYPVGSLADNGADEVFEALRSSDNGNPHGLAETDFWVSRGNVQYVNPGDLVEFSPALYYFPVAPDTNFTIRIYGFNTLSGIYDKQVKDTKVEVFDTPQSLIAISLVGLPVGMYRVQINTESRHIYLDSSAIYKNVFGLVEVFCHLPAANAFGLLKADGTSKQNTFTIHFANRQVLWKYNARTADVTAINDTTYSFSSPVPKQFVSNKPIPLQEEPIKTISLNSATLGNVSPLPNPPRDRLMMLDKGGDKFFCAEIFLNY